MRVNANVTSRRADSSLVRRAIEGDGMKTSSNVSPTRPAAIEVKRLTKTYPGGIEAVKGIDFVVPTGEVFGLVGPNGAGKSTTIGILTTTVAPSTGSARVMGRDV